MIDRYVIDERKRSSLLCVSSKDYLHGCLSVTERGEWAHPERFTPNQVAQISSCMAWHPGVFKAMAQATSGVRVSFRTDATEVALLIRLAQEPRPTQKQLAAQHDETRAAHDGITIEVDGHKRPCFMPRPLAYGISGIDAQGAALVSFSVEENQADECVMVPLPGFGVMHEVSIWLPALRSAEVSYLWLDSQLIEPVEQEDTLLVLGDSIAQGFIADDPAQSWPALLTEALDADLLNQSIYGQVFQQGFCNGLSSHVAPSRVMVALGTNYRFEACAALRTKAEIDTSIAEIAHEWPDVPIDIITPIAFDEKVSPIARKSCYREVSHFIQAAAARHENVSVYDGTKLVDVTPQHICPDGDHLTLEGNATFARRLGVLMGARVPVERRRARAQELLTEAPLCALPLQQMLAQRLAEPLFAEKGCIFARLATKEQILFATDADLAHAVLALMAEPSMIDALGETSVMCAQGACGMDAHDDYHLAIYEGSGISIDTKRHSSIQPLDESYLPDILKHYSYPEILDPSVVRKHLQEGLFLGAFAEGTLVGFIGEHTLGSMGMLEVFPGHRREGLGEVLVASKVAALLAVGRTPWTEIYPSNKMSLRLHKKLGFTILPAEESSFVSAQSILDTLNKK